LAEGTTRNDGEQQQSRHVKDFRQAGERPRAGVVTRRDQCGQAAAQESDRKLLSKIGQQPTLCIEVDQYLAAGD
jgi:hypothetical protein